MAGTFSDMWVLVLCCFTPAFHSIKINDPKCRLDSSELSGTMLRGDTMIGLIFPIYLDRLYPQITFTEKPPKTFCTMFTEENYQILQTALFAADEINNDPNLLPNMTIGLQMYDSCDTTHLALQGTLQVMTGLDTAIPNYRCLQESPLTAIIGASHSTHSIALAHILGLTRHPQISMFSTSPLLSDRTKFPSFFRIVPSDTFQSDGLARLVLYYGWSWVGLLAADNDYGQYGIQLVKQELIKAGACVEYMENILMSRPDRNAPHIIKVIKRSTSKVVVVYSNDADLMPVLNEWLKQNVSKKVLIASDAWSITNIFSVGKKYSELLAGTIGFAFSSGTLPGLKQFLNKVDPYVTFGKEWIKIFWEQIFNCTYVSDGNITAIQWDLTRKQCTGTESLESIQNIYNDVSNLRHSYNIYTAVHVVANVLDDLRRCQHGSGPFSMSTCADKQNYMPWQVLHYVKKVRFRLNSGRELYFDENGDSPAVYDIVNWQLTPDGILYQAKVGSYDTSSREIFTINTSSILWPIEDYQVSQCSKSCQPGLRKAARTGEPICCYECVPCAPGEISNQTDSVDCWKCPWDEWPNPENSQCLPKTVEYLSYEDSLGTTLTVMSLGSFLAPITIMKMFVRHKNSPLVKANNYYISCLLLVSLSLCLLCPLMFIGHPNTETCLLRQVAFGMAFALSISCVLAKTVIVIFVFMATKPHLRKWINPKVSYLVILNCSFLQLILCIAWLSLTPPFPQHNTQSKAAIIIIECNEGSPVAFWTLLGYLFLLATISFVVAFLARRLPDSFNEAQYITFSMLAFLSVWISYIPASLSAQGKYTVAMEIFAILASSWALIICMFFPKCFILLFRPEMNSREYLVRNPTLKK